MVNLLPFPFEASFLGRHENSTTLNSLYELATAITSVNCFAKLPITWSQYDSLSVLANRVTIYLSNSGGCTCATKSLHLWAYFLILSLSPFSRLDKLVLLGAMPILYLYCLTKASTRSFHFWILMLSSLMYQLNVALLKLSQKKYISSFSSCTTSAILLQQDLWYVIEHCVSVYLMNSGTQNFFSTTIFGTRHIFAARTGSYKSTPSMTLILASNDAILSFFNGPDSSFQ